MPSVRRLLRLFPCVVDCAWTAIHEWRLRMLSLLDQASSILRRSLGHRQLRECAHASFEHVRYSSLCQFSASILDTYIPRCRRLTQLHFGRIVTNPDAPQAFSTSAPAPGFNMTYNLVEPFKGNALHVHEAVEIFIALDGEWELAWGAEGKQSTILQPYDLIAVPARVRHSYKNVRPHTAHNICTLLPGEATIEWAPAVVAEAREHGAQCTDDGVLIDFWSERIAPPPEAAPPHEAPPHKAELVNQSADDIKATLDLLRTRPDTYHRPMSDEAMARNVRRFADRKPLVMQAPEGDMMVRWLTLERGERFAPERSVAPDMDVLAIVLEGDAMISAARGKEVTAATRLDAIRIPARDSRSGIAIRNDMSPPCTLLLVESRLRSLTGKTPSDDWVIM